MPSSRDDLLRTLIPPATAVILTLIYFAIFNRWDQYHDPINSVVVMILGTLGFAAGVGLDLLRRNRRRTPAATAESTTPSA
ncbi:MAG: hypothetical protein ACYDCQ_23010 [Dehalococcoidia bacterium]